MSDFSKHESLANQHKGTRRKNKIPVWEKLIPKSRLIDKTNQKQKKVFRCEQKGNTKKKPGQRKKMSKSQQDVKIEPDKITSALIAYTDNQHDRAINLFQEADDFQKKKYYEGMAYFKQEKYLDSIVKSLQNNLLYQEDEVTVKLRIKSIRFFNQNLYHTLVRFAKLNELSLEKETKRNIAFLERHEFQDFVGDLYDQIFKKGQTILLAGENNSIIEISVFSQQFIDEKWKDHQIVLNFLKIAHIYLGVIQEIERYSKKINVAYDEVKYKELLEQGIKYSQICCGFQLTKQDAIMLPAQFLYYQQNYLNAQKWIEQMDDIKNSQQNQFMAKCMLHQSKFEESNDYLKKALMIDLSFAQINLDDINMIWQNFNQQQENNDKEKQQVQLPKEKLIDVTTNIDHCDLMRKQNQGYQNQREIQEIEVIEDFIIEL